MNNDFRRGAIEAFAAIVAYTEGMTDVIYAAMRYVFEGKKVAILRPGEINETVAVPLAEVAQRAEEINPDCFVSLDEELNAEEM